MSVDPYADDSVLIVATRSGAERAVMETCSDFGLTMSNPKIKSDRDPIAVEGGVVKKFMYLGS